ncbi:ABC transporter ATP-binding protein [Ethanoligenens harbinense]|uniref:ABC transporter ATP-binding protein n=1 Tax=Ethanoligenens harbinense TaxID=253239 RepID=UPI000EA28A09|nr:ABC transporter ATP-binding protein [Ethanoligenens harbinense]AYF41774.1 peptide ABC transporter ATP-binding protein [Ethanoligenens harbinense]
MLLSVKRLSVGVQIGPRACPAVEDVSFDVERGETFGIVGESGCGKSLTALAVARLLGENLRIEKGTVLFEGRDLTRLDAKDMTKLRGSAISIIFQDATDNLNPLMPVGRQVEDVLRAHTGMNRRQACPQALDLLARVCLPSPSEAAGKYPHQLSGGQRQRVMIAMAIAAKPRLLIADEPTTALDLTTQASILALLKELQKENGMGLILISHDISVIRRCCDRVAVMYAGHIVETGPCVEVFGCPAHPYSRGLIRAVPSASMKGKKLPYIEGFVPSLEERVQAGCGFLPRCARRLEACSRSVEEHALSPLHKVCCNAVEMGAATDE